MTDYKHRFMNQAYPQTAETRVAHGTGETPSRPARHTHSSSGGHNSYIVSILNPEAAQSIPDLHSEPHIIKKTKTYDTITVDAALQGGDLVFYYSPQSHFGEVLMGVVTTGGDRIAWLRYIGLTQDVFSQYFQARAIGSNLSVVSDTRSLNSAQLNGSFLATVLFRSFDRDPPTIVNNENQEFSKNVSIKDGLALTMVPTGSQDFRSKTETAPASTDDYREYTTALNPSHFFTGLATVVTVFDCHVGSPDDAPEAFDGYQVGISLRSSTSIQPATTRRCILTPYFLDFTGNIQLFPSIDVKMSQVSIDISVEALVQVPPQAIPMEGFLIQFNGPNTNYLTIEGRVTVRTYRANAPGRNTLIVCDKVTDGVTIRLTGMNAFEAIPKKALAKDLQARSTINMDAKLYSDSLNYIHLTSNVDIRCLKDLLTPDEVAMMSDLRVISHTLATGSFWGGVKRFFRAAPSFARRAWNTTTKPILANLPLISAVAGYPELSPGMMALSNYARGSGKPQYHATGSGRAKPPNRKVHVTTKIARFVDPSKVSIPTELTQSSVDKLLKSMMERKVSSQDAEVFAKNVFNDAYWSQPPDEKLKATGSGRPHPPGHKDGPKPPLSGTFTQILDQELKDFLKARTTTKSLLAKLVACVCTSETEKKTKASSIEQVKKLVAHLEDRISTLEDDIEMDRRSRIATGSGRPSDMAGLVDDGFLDDLFGEVDKKFTQPVVAKPDKFSKLFSGSAKIDDIKSLSPSEIVSFINTLADRTSKLAEEKHMALKEKSLYGGEGDLDETRIPLDSVRSEFAAVQKLKFRKEKKTKGMVSAVVVRRMADQTFATRTIMYVSSDPVGLKTYHSIGNYLIDSTYDVKDAASVLAIVDKIVPPYKDPVHISFVSEDPVYDNTLYSHQSFAAAICLAIAGVVTNSPVTGLLTQVPGQVAEPSDLNIKMDMVGPSDPPMYVGSQNTVTYQSAAGVKEVPTATEVVVRGAFPSITAKGGRVVSFNSIAGLIAALQKHGDIARAVRSPVLPGEHKVRSISALTKLIKKNAAPLYNSAHYLSMLEATLNAANTDTANKASRDKLQRKLSNLLTTMMGQTATKSKRPKNPSKPKTDAKVIYAAFQKLDKSSLNRSQRGTYDKMIASGYKNGVPTSNKNLNRMMQLVGPMLRKSKAERNRLETLKKKGVKGPKKAKPKPVFLDLSDEEMSQSELEPDDDSYDESLDV